MIPENLIIPRKVLQRDYITRYSDICRRFPVMECEKFRVLPRFVGRVAVALGDPICKRVALSRVSKLKTLSKSDNR